MKLSAITEKDIIEAGIVIDFIGIPLNNLYNYYWVELANGKEYPFKYLMREAYKIATGSGEELDFQSTEAYRNYVRELGFGINNYFPSGLNFFKNEEIALFQKLAGTKYRKANPENIRESKLLLPSIKKLNYWASNSLIEDFTVKEDNHWHWSGTIKEYLWLRIYRKGDSKNVYFVLGINKKGELYLELNCQRSNHTGGKVKGLPSQIVIQLDNYLYEADYDEKKIDLKRLHHYNWNSLIEFTQNYFYKYAALYDELELIAANKNVKQIPNEYTLTEEGIPDKTKSYLNNERSFKGRKTDWGKKQAVSSKLGLLGEELVLHIEKKKLEVLGLIDKVEKVQKKLDGEGYDILSFDEKGNEIFIEVKTTKGDWDEPFYLSVNEKAFWELNKENYRIYRLYRYDHISKSAQYYKITGKELFDFDLNPINYEVSKSLTYELKNGEK